MIVYLILTVLLCVGTSMICSLLEATLLSLSPVRLESLHREGKTYAGIWIELKKNINKPIAAILIFNTIANTGGASLAGYLFDKVFGIQYLGFFLAGLTLSILFLSEIFPKFLGAVYADRLAPLLATPLYLLTKVSTPMIIVTDLVGHLFKRKGQEQQLTATDIEVMAQLARAGRVIGAEQERIIVNAAKLSDITVADVMVPASGILFLNLSQPIRHNFRIARRALHTRYPVSSTDSVNDIHAYVNFKDLAAIEAEYEEHEIDEVDLRSLARPILTLPPTDNLNRAFRELTARRYHIAIVRDEERQVIGLLSLEDLIEELLGEIEDEYDVTSDLLMPLGVNYWRVGGAMPLERLGAIIEEEWVHNLPQQNLGQWLQQRLASGHHPGHSLIENGVEFTVHQARKGRIFQVTIEKLSPGDPRLSATS
ncbi:MAG: hemolysin family protein [Candidatus Methylacidiphilales bacterium]